jgi:hypothetical protein
MNELVQIEGEVIDHSRPVKIPGSYFSINFITVKCPIEKAVKAKNEYAYYVITSYKKHEANKAFKGCQIKCTVQRESSIWQKNEIWQYKHNTRIYGQTKIDLGSHPIIFERYILVSDIDVIPPEGMQNDDDDDLPF